MTNIGVFDSGLGGLSVLNELVKKKNANYYYLGDSLRAPYGSRPQKEIIKFSDEIVIFLENYNIDRYIIACNTISTLATDFLQEKYQKPFYPITKAGLENALLFKGDYLVLGTQSTVDSHFYKNSIEKLSSSKVYEIAAPNLVKLIENGDIEGPLMDKELKSYLEIANQKQIPNIILGCTHYPIIRNSIEKNLNYNANIINPASNIGKKINFEDSDDISVNIFMTKVNEENKKLIDKILDCNYYLEEKEI